MCGKPEACALSWSSSLDKWDLITGRLGSVSVCCVQCSEGDSMLKIIFLIFIVPWNPGMLASRARRSNDVPCMDFPCPLALVRQLESVGGVENTHHLLKVCKKMPSLQVPMGSNDAVREYLICTGFKRAARECHDRSCSPALAMEQGSVATICAC